MNILVFFKNCPASPCQMYQLRQVSGGCVIVPVYIYMGESYYLVFCLRC